MSRYLTPVIAAAFGLVFGSFLNVCIYRLPRRLSVVTPRSRCTSCGHTLSWFENIPVLSWMVLRGRCRGCAAAISWQYPLVEVTTAVVFALGVIQFDIGLLLVSRLALAAALIVLFVIDLQHRILPNAITLPGIVAGFVFSLFTEPGWTSAAIGIAIGGGVLLAIAEAYYRIRHEHGLGMGDVKMLAMIGAFLGWKLTLLTLVLSSFAGSMIGVAMIVSRRGNMKYALPFGTFLAMGAVLAITVGPAVLEWYLKLWQ
jgi:leader peptidase (prepilin peptidase)/N-methyltransferase